MKENSDTKGNQRVFPLEKGVKLKDRLRTYCLPFVLGTSAATVFRLGGVYWLLLLALPATDFTDRTRRKALENIDIDFKDYFFKTVFYLMGTSVPYSDKIYYVAREHLPQVYQVLENIVGKF